jgi:hypothetical protein
MIGAIPLLPLHAFVAWTRTTLPVTHTGSKPQFLGRPVISLVTPTYRPCNRDEVAGEWRKLYNEETNDMHSSPNISRVIISRNTYGRGELHSGIWWGNLRERDHLEDLGVDGRIISRWIFRKWEGGGGGLD